MHTDICALSAKGKRGHGTLPRRNRWNVNRPPTHTHTHTHTSKGLQQRPWDKAASGKGCPTEDCWDCPLALTHLTRRRPSKSPTRGCRNAAACWEKLETFNLFTSPEHPSCYITAVASKKEAAGSYLSCGVSVRSLHLLFVPAWGFFCCFFFLQLL